MSEWKPCVRGDTSVIGRCVRSRVHVSDEEPRGSEFRVAHITPDKQLDLHDGTTMRSGNSDCFEMLVEVNDDWDKKYPEHAKLRAVKEQSQKLGEFLAWMKDEKEWTICKLHDGRNWATYEPVDPQSIEMILADYFEIDRNALSDEKDRMVDEMRASQ